MRERRLWGRRVDWKMSAQLRLGPIGLQSAQGLIEVRINRENSSESHHFEYRRHCRDQSGDNEASALFAELVMGGQNGLEPGAINVIQSSAIDHNLEITAFYRILEALFNRPRGIRIQVTLESQNESVSLFRFVDLHWGVSTRPALSSRRP